MYNLYNLQVVQILDGFYTHSDILYTYKYTLYSCIPIYIKADVPGVCVCVCVWVGGCGCGCGCACMCGGALVCAFGGSMFVWVRTTDIEREGEGEGERANRSFSSIIDHSWY